MQYLLLVYTDEKLLAELGQAAFDERMKHCLEHADTLCKQGKLLGFQQLEDPRSAKTVRVREGRTAITDGPFAETKEILGGFNLIEARSLEEAVEIARSFPWTAYGAIEVRPVRDVGEVRRRVGA